MKETTKRGILAGISLSQSPEDYISALIEQQEETKPSRINNKTLKKKKTKYKKDRFDDEWDD